MKKLSKSPGTAWKTVGVILILCALVLTAYNIIDGMRAGNNVIDALEQLIIDTPLTSDEAGETVIPDYVLNPDMDMPSEEIKGFRYIGKLDIPGLRLSLPVIKEWSYPGLKRAPCCYTGSIYKDNMVIAGHNYPRHFGSLKKLHQGDEVIFTDIDGNVFNYEVLEVEILEPTAIEEMVSGDWDLTLFTCTVGGQSRVTVRCGKNDTK